MCKLYAPLIMGLLLLLMSCPDVSGALPPDVELNYPTDGYIATSADNLTFICNATDDENIYSVSLYNDMSGNFSLHETNFTMGFHNGTDTLLHCGFDSSYTCLQGETGTHVSTSFETSHMRESVVVDDEEDDTLYYPTSGNIGYGYGTIQMWFKTSPSFDPYESEDYFFSLGGSSMNEVEIWNNYGTLAFYFYDTFGRLSWAQADITGWSDSEIHHVAAIWDHENIFGTGNAVDLFIDGSNSSTTRSLDYYCGESFSGNMYIGSHTAGYGQPAFELDEFAIYNKPLTQSVISSTYSRYTSDHSEETINWTIKNLDDGTYKWNCMAYDNESQSSWHSSNYTLIVDASTPPSLVSVDMTPSSAEKIDPQVSINITANMTDPSNVSNVILMYKSPYAGIYTNDTMDYNSGTGLWENGTIVTNTDEGNWSYRFWANDTWGHAGMTDVYTLAVEKERSWIVSIYNVTSDESQTIGSVNGFKGTEERLGMVFINNTGDYIASFDLSSQLDVSYNVSEPFDLSPGSTKLLEINLTLPETPNEYLVEVTFTTTSDPASRTINGSAISYIGGPYINETVTITDYPSSISQSGSGNFTARVKNIGNETAENVTINWTLPLGWSISYGNDTQLLGNLSPYEKSDVIITASASPSALAGAARIWINATTLSGDSSGSDYVLVSLLCTSGDGTCGAGCTYANDGDCEPPASTRGGETKVVGVGTVGAPGEASMSVSVPPRLDLTKGEKVTFLVNVTNEGGTGTNVSGITLEMDGYDAALMDYSPDTISQLGPGKQGSFMVVLDVPHYLEERDYFVSFRVNARGAYIGGFEMLEVSASSVFAVHGAMESDTLNAIEEARSALEEMIAAGLRTEKLSDLLEDALRAYERLDFDTASELAERVVNIKRTAFSVLSSFEIMGRDIDDAERYGMSVEETKKMTELAKSAFQRGDYSRAEARITAAINAYQLETKNLIGMLRFLYEYWYMVIGIAVAVLASSLFARKRISIRAAETRIKGAKNKREALMEMLKRLQVEYYEKRAMSKMEYMDTRDSYQKRLAAISSEELRLKRRLASMKHGKKKDKLMRAKNEAEGMFKKLQSDYFEKGLMGKREYESALEELQGEIGQIEKELAKAGNPGKKATLYMTVIFLALIVAYSGTSGVKFTGNVLAGGGSTAEQLASDSIGEAVTVIDEMEGLGFNTERLNDTLENARISFSRGEYDLALTASRYVKILKQKALIVYDLVDETETRIQEVSSQGIDTGDARDMFSAALEEFENENYEDSEVTLTSVMDMLDEAERTALLERAAGGDVLRSAYSFLRENALYIALVSVVAVIVSVPVSIRIRRFKRYKKVERLKAYADDIKSSMKRLQEDYFNKGGIGKKSYQARMKKYRKELADTTEDLLSEK